MREVNFKETLKEAVLFKLIKDYVLEYLFSRHSVHLRIFLDIGKNITTR